MKVRRIEEWIREQRKLGLDYDEMKEILKSYGFSGKIVDDFKKRDSYLRSLERKTPMQIIRESRRKMFVLLVMLILFILLVTYYCLRLSPWVY
ncbi:MAG: hypothetical protein DRP11_01345 [Candidatus Aenigmatarchaeota archaeon]|nr:MAG: hypothetical protein DRP11_01345 [Candidatus Aenigmarchaeota archaeon]